MEMKQNMDLEKEPDKFYSSRKPKCARQEFVLAYSFNLAGKLLGTF